MLIRNFAAASVQPEYFAVLLAFLPVLELLALLSQVLCELSLVLCPVELELSLCLLYIAIDRVCLDAADRASLHEVGFLVPCDSSHQSAQVNTLHPANPQPLLSKDFVEGDTL